MADLAWPAGRHWSPAPDSSIGITVPRSRFGAFYSGQTYGLSHSAERLRITMILPPCGPDEAAEREAFVLGLVSEGDRVLLSHPVRYEPRGTLRGTPTVRTDRNAQTETLTIQTTAGATLLPGDVLGLNGQLLMVRTGDTANGSGQMSVQLVTRLHTAAAAGAGITWQRPTAPFQLRQSEIEMGYGRGRWQRRLELNFYEFRA